MYSGKFRSWLASDILPEQIISKLRAIEVHLGSGMTKEQAANREEISVQSYFCWCQEYGCFDCVVCKLPAEKSAGFCIVC